MQIWTLFIQTFATRVIFSPQWQYSVGCAQEFLCAQECGVQTTTFLGEILTVEYAVQLLQESTAEIAKNLEEFVIGKGPVHGKQQNQGITQSTSAWRGSSLSNESRYGSLNEFKQSLHGSISVRPPQRVHSLSSLLSHDSPQTKQIHLGDAATILPNSRSTNGAVWHSGQLYSPCESQNKPNCSIHCSANFDASSERRQN